MEISPVQFLLEKERTERIINSPMHPIEGKGKERLANTRLDVFGER